MIKKDKKLKSLLLKSQDQQQRTKLKAQQVTNLLNPSNEVTIEVDGDKPLLKYSQDELRQYVPQANTRNMFQLDLPYGPYNLSLTSTHVYLAGSRGHVAVFNWRTKQMQCEFDLHQKIRSVHWVAQENFVLAQDKSLYMYDCSGTELHKMKEHRNPHFTEYLPYHFILASLNDIGSLLYQDITQGAIVAKYQTAQYAKCLSQNKGNATLAVGDSMGVVKMHSPNQATPLLSMLCHKSSCNTVDFTREGSYMITGGGEGCVKVWDLRVCKQLGNDIILPQAPQQIKISQRNVTAISCGNQILFFNQLFLNEQSHKLMMRHSTSSYVIDMEFIDHEDYLGLTTATQYQQLLVPESGDPKIDTYEFWHSQSKKQRAESNIRALLEKLPPSSICLNPQLIGTIDKASKDVIRAEEKVEKQAQEERKQQKLKKKNKMRGRNSAKERYLLKEAQRTEEQQQKWQEQLSENMRIRKAEKVKKRHEIEILKQLDMLNPRQFIKIVSKSKKIQKKSP